MTRRETEQMGELFTLLAATTIEDDTPVTSTAVADLDGFVTAAMLLLTVSAKVFDAATTMDVYVQYSPDEGTTWDDLAHFAQITNAAIGNGTYIAYIAPGASAADRVTTNGTLAANSVRSIPWCDRVRVKCVGANIAGTDTITLKVQGFFR
jgi:hypothetical protein